MSKKTIYTLVWAGMALLAVAATVKISEYPAVTTPGDTDLFLLASGTTNKNITYANLKTSVNTGLATSTQLASATNLSRQAATNEAKTYTDAQITGLSSTYATPAQLLSATNLAVQAATNSAKDYTDAVVADLELGGLPYDAQIGSSILTNLSGLSNTNELAFANQLPGYQPLLPDPITNGHTSPITINTDVEINGNFTVNSTNATTTVSNMVVNGTLTGDGVNTVSNATWGASKTYSDTTFATKAEQQSGTNLIYSAGTAYTDNKVKGWTRYQNNTGTIVLGQQGLTNITGDITLGGFSGVDAALWQNAAYTVTNSTATTYKVSLPAGVSLATNSFCKLDAGTFNVYVTNSSKVQIGFSVDSGETNAAAVRYPQR